MNEIYLNHFSFNLCALFMAHFLCDFALQNDFVAKFKARNIEGTFNQIWLWVLTAHCSIHALAVLLITKSITLSVLMLISHFVIDFLKCEKRISFNQDQILHLLVVLAMSTQA